MATATAAGVLMAGAALAGDYNQADIYQFGSENTLTVDQGSSTNGIAGRPGYMGAQLRQIGDHNDMDVVQSGRKNQVANSQPSVAYRGAYQTGNWNVLSITQDSGVAAGSAGSTDGNYLEQVRQNSSTLAGSLTNKATIVQQRVETGVSTLAASNNIKLISQTHTGGASQINEITVTQTGEHSAWYGGGQGNIITSITQNGSSNTASVEQKGTGPLLSTSGNQRRGPANTITTISQLGSTQTATINQNGFANYTGAVSQSGGDGNTIWLELNGDYNGATPPTANGNRSTVGVLTLNSGAVASQVTQIGTSNDINYVTTGNSNQYGFYQNGTDNEAVGITITGSYNELGVWQDGDRNKLLVGTVEGSDNVVGLTQDGNDNTASLKILGGSSDKNGGYNGFTPLGDAAGANLTAGLIVQYGDFNNVDLEVNGSDNVFATLQDNAGLGASLSNGNTIVGKVTGSDNEVAVKQIGNNNNANFVQTGGNNNAYISQ